MYRLYWEAMSGAIAPEVMLAEMALPFERVHIDMAAGEHRSADFLAINPTGQVPALQLPDGVIIGESGAMVMTLGDCHPDHGLVPRLGEADRPTFLRWLFYMAASVYMTFVRVNHPERFTTQPDCLSGVYEAAVAAVNAQFAILDDAIAGEPWFLPRGFGALDIYLTMLTVWHPDRDGLFASRNRLGRLCRAVESRSTMAETMAHHRA